MKLLITVLLCLSAYAFTDQMMSLEELAKFDIKSVDCAKSDQISLVEKQMQQWEDLLKHQKAISHDIKILKSMEHLLSSKSNSFLEVQTQVSGKKLMKKLHKLELPLTKSQIGLVQVQLLKDQCKGLDSENPEERAQAKKELCKLLKEYVNNLNNCKKQCSNSPVTVIKIKGQIKDLEIIRDNCSSGKVNGVKVITLDGENQEYNVASDGTAEKQ
ncbi:unnamed protein product (macronuclear) [Paramecium tetraurelia]|uniref:Chromosome undetermined scaffold_1, whole genome shotgun sequence n=1 Tax=Paramecium tetraurelia TaxID=5888 RepID=Q6BGC1_PARTE|nr:hypothetical protein [Paramecium tetraurelia strain d4-2]XP_001423402.1 uncharacterized protein GSPATT00000439001 [Paramecium tetraurelia]CAH03299.1 hypothetical protein PTMB.102c [Paramecium tetraurelia]CAK56004.1 unnamed protein product [Paramecium tetraurelia]|eukprot:XP_001423402.1 hypothetical protein (macronuclear) [Paramecium tetraurelia strain d4-2]